MTPSTKDEATALALVIDTLSSEERRMITLYRATASEWRADIVDYANMVAKMFPLLNSPAAPGIRLVGAGGKGEVP